MLAELLSSITTPAPRWARAMGFVDETVSIETLWKRNRRSYEAHRRRCYHVILSADKELLRKQRVVVLGAGVVRDVPLVKLSEQFSEVLLVDCVFSRRTRRFVRDLPNVRLITHDLAGVCQQLHQARQGGPLPDPENLLPSEADLADYVVSLNLLSQLAISPERYAREKHLQGKVPEWGTRIEQAHLDALRKLKGRVLLVTDFSRVRHEKTVLDQDEEDTLHTELAAPDEEWEWNIRPNRHRGYKLRVGSWLLP